VKKVLLSICLALFKVVASNLTYFARLFNLLWYNCNWGKCFSFVGILHVAVVFIIYRNLRFAQVDFFLFEDFSCSVTLLNFKDWRKFNCSSTLGRWSFYRRIIESLFDSFFQLFVLAYDCLKHILGSGQLRE
jgi:hypothetical protein